MTTRETRIPTKATTMNEKMKRGTMREVNCCDLTDYGPAVVSDVLGGVMWLSAAD